MNDYYTVLGVPETATDQEIRAAYHRLLQESLMDNERFEAVRQAYEALSSRESRQAHDRGRQGAGKPAQEQNAAPAATVTLAAGATQAIRPGGPPDSERTGTHPLRRPGGGDATVAMLPTSCPVCSHLNPPGETYCAECGFLLSQAAEKGAFLPSEDDLRKWPHLENESGQMFVLKPGSNTVGRESADILIADKTVSRHHATIVFHEDRSLFSVEDMSSTNGTAVNGVPLPSGVPHPIHAGDAIRFGSCPLSLVVDKNSGVERAKADDDDDSDDDEDGVDSTWRQDRDPAPAGALAHLVLAQGFGPREVVIKRGITTVGRLPDNMLALKHDRYVSGHHARIVAEDGIFRLLDVGSTNGTMLNGLRLTTNEAIAISEGDEISFGGTIYQFNVIGREPAPEDAEPSQVGAEEAEAAPDGA